MLHKLVDIFTSLKLTIAEPCAAAAAEGEPAAVMADREVRRIYLGIEA